MHFISYIPVWFVRMSSHSCSSLYKTRIKLPFIRTLYPQTTNTSKSWHWWKQCFTACSQYPKPFILSFITAIKSHEISVFLGLHNEELFWNVGKCCSLIFICLKWVFKLFINIFWAMSIECDGVNNEAAER